MAGSVPPSVLGLLPAGYPGNRTTLVAARDKLKTAVRASTNRIA